MYCSYGQHNDIHNIHDHFYKFFMVVPLLRICRNQEVEWQGDSEWLHSVIQPTGISSREEIRVSMVLQWSGEQQLESHEVRTIVKGVCTWHLIPALPPAEDMITKKNRC